MTRSGARHPPRRAGVATGVLAVVVAGVAGFGLLRPDAEPAEPQGPPSATVSADATPGTGREATGAPAETGPEPVPTAGPGMDDVSEAAVALGPARARALTSLERQHVTVYSLPDSPAHEGELLLLDELASQELHYAGLSLETHVVGAVEHTDPSTATVPVELTISPYRTVSAEGETVAESATPTVERFTVEMKRTAGGWLVREILP